MAQQTDLEGRFILPLRSFCITMLTADYGGKVKYLPDWRFRDLIIMADMVKSKGKDKSTT